MGYTSRDLGDGALVTASRRNGGTSFMHGAGLDPKAVAFQHRAKRPTGGRLVWIEPDDQHACESEEALFKSLITPSCLLVTAARRYSCSTPATRSFRILGPNASSLPNDPRRRKSPPHPSGLERDQISPRAASLR